MEQSTNNTTTLYHVKKTKEDSPSHSLLTKSPINASQEMKIITNRKQKEIPLHPSILIHLSLIPLSNQANRNTPPIKIIPIPYQITLISYSSHNT
jgi:hypothetical protein